MKRIRIRLISFDRGILEKASGRITRAFESTRAVIRGPVPLKTKREVYTVLRSPHANKDAREQFQQCVYRLLFDIYLPLVQPKTIEILKRLELPAGVEAEVQA